MLTAAVATALPYLEAVGTVPADGPIPAWLEASPPWLQDLWREKVGQYMTVAEADADLARLDRLWDFSRPAAPRVGVAPSRQGPPLTVAALADAQQGSELPRRGPL